MQNTDIIKDKLNIVDVVGSYVKLEKAGKTYKGKSPFTNEKTPSFFVSPEKGFFYCFSSGKGGDMFTFIQEIERIEFRDALKILAEKAGVTLYQSKVNIEKITRTQVQYKILDDATKWYEVHLRKNPHVVEHLLERGLTKETMVKFRIGFALDSWQDIYEYLLSRKYSNTDIEAVGLVIKKDNGGYYDRFRSRIMFPLFDGRGRVVGFSGRMFGQETEKSGAKYVNSPEGPLFNKSKVLYGYHSAKSEMSKQNACILVEGQFDVLMAQQSGYLHTVAISGTGLNDDSENTLNQDYGLDYNFGSQVQMIKRFTNNLLFAFDSDKAGVKATRRSVLAAYKHGLNVKVIVLPEGMDPADIILKSKSQWDICVLDAKDYLEYRLDLLNRKKHSFEEKKALVDNDLFTFVSLTKSAMVQDKMLQKLALFLGVSIEAVRNDFKQFIPDEEFESTLVSESQDLSSDNTNPKEQILYLESYLQEKNIQQDPNIAQEKKDIYKELFGTDMEADLALIPEATKNLQLFILGDQYKGTANSVLQKSVHTFLIQEKIRRIDLQSLILLEKLRNAESEKNIKSVKKYMKQQQDLLQLKTNLTHSLK